MELLLWNNSIVSKTQINFKNVFLIFLQQNQQVFQQSQ